MISVTPLGIKYRGFALGYAVGRYGYIAAWRSSFDTAWRCGHMYVDRVEDIPGLRGKPMRSNRDCGGTGTPPATFPQCASSAGTGPYHPERP